MSIVKWSDEGRENRRQVDIQPYHQLINKVGQPRKETTSTQAGLNPLPQPHSTLLSMRKTNDIMGQSYIPNELFCFQ